MPYSAEDLTAAAEPAALEAAFALDVPVPPNVVAAPEVVVPEVVVPEVIVPDVVPDVMPNAVPEPGTDDPEPALP